MSVINTNTKSIVAQNAMTVNNRSLSKAMEQLSTGKRINGAADDAAGLAISSKMTSQIKGLNQAVRNANDGISLIQTAEGALVEVSNMLQRMRELAVQSANDTNTTSDRSALNSEFGQLRTEINRIATNTQWNGMNILDKTANSTGEFKFQVGANAAQNISLTIGNYGTANVTQGTTAAVTTTTAASGPGATAAAQVSTFTVAGTPALGDVITASVGDKSFTHTVIAGASTTAQTVTEIAAAINTGLGTIAGVGSAVSAGVITFTASSGVAGSNSFTIGAGTGGLLSGISGSSITSQANANSSIAAVDTALSTVNSGRAEMGATINRLNYAADNLMNVSQNTAESRSRILDTDYAQTTTELARTQIISQAATAMLAQANQAPQSVLSLLR
jgi:flagellin